MLEGLMSRAYFVVVIFFVAGVLLFAVYLRSNQNRIFYKYCLSKSEQSRLNQQLGKKHLQLESMINPAAVSETFDKYENQR